VKEHRFRSKKKRPKRREKYEGAGENIANIS